jgi:heat shock protein HslJ
VKALVGAVASFLIPVFPIWSAAHAAESAARPVVAGEPIPLGALKNATYHGLQFVKDPITLSDGKWQGPPYAPGDASRPSVTFSRDFHISADLDADGHPYAIVLLVENNGGSGSLASLAVVKRQDGNNHGKLVNVATALLGDRVQVRNLEVRGRRIGVTMVQAGRSDAACCPGELVTRVWEYVPAGLREVKSAGEPTRLSLAAIAGRRWTLRYWDWKTPAPERPEVTLTYEDGRLAGNGGCNQYFATAKPGAAPGDLSIGPIGATRVFCAAPAGEIEQRFFRQLEAVTKYGFMAGQLALTYQTGGAVNVMLFDPRKEPATTR